MHPIQLAGAALVLVGVMLVTAQPGADRSRPQPSRRPDAPPDA
jgi:drug/metabolite transporter (DMT)-like permease